MKWRVLEECLTRLIRCDVGNTRSGDRYTSTLCAPRQSADGEQQLQVLAVLQNLHHEITDLLAPRPGIYHHASQEEPLIRGKDGAR